MLGSLVEDEDESWGIALEAYRAERPLSRGAARPDRGQNFVVRPLIVGKLFAKIVGKVQKKPPLATTSILQWNVLLPRQAAL